MLEVGHHSKAGLRHGDGSVVAGEQVQGGAGENPNARKKRKSNGGRLWEALVHSLVKALKHTRRANKDKNLLNVNGSISGTSLLRIQQ